MDSFKLTQFLWHEQFFRPMIMIIDKGPVNIYGKTGPGNERWPVVKFTVAPLILLYKIAYGPVTAWPQIFHGPVEIFFQIKC